MSAGAAVAWARRWPLPARPGLDAWSAALHLADDARPVVLTGGWAGGGALLASDPVRSLGPGGDPFDALDDLPALRGEVPPAFVGGGWFGWLGYRAGRRVEARRAPGAAAPADGPRRPVAGADADLALHDHLVRLDADGRWWFEALWTEATADRLQAALERWAARLVGPAPEVAPTRFGEARPTPDRAGHCGAVEAVQLRIAAGDLYQANVCLRLDLDAQEAGGGADQPGLLAAWAAAARSLRPDRAAFVGRDRGAIASLSPEVFLVRSPDGRTVRCDPVKGTRPKTEAGLRELRASTKDRAEHVMIVDLVRNDLTRAGGATSVPTTLEARAMAGVWHLVSSVVAEVDPAAPNAGIVRAAFPPGSVTGAPKLAALDACDDVEATAREAYCGAIGFASPAAGLELSVAIRTLEVAGRRAWLGVGGGVVADSEPLAEWEECRAKAAPVLAALGSVWPDARPAPLGAGQPRAYETLLVLDGRAVRLAAHVDRFRAATGIDVADRVLAAARDLGAGACRLRVEAPIGGGPEDVELRAEPCELPACVAGRPLPVHPLVPVPCPGGWGSLKHADRRWLEAAEAAAAAEAGPAALALLVDGDDVLETSRAAVAALCQGVLVAPALDGRILPSTSRRALLDAAVDLGVPVRIGRLAMAELAGADAVLVSSAVRLLVLGRVHGADAEPWRPPPAPVADLAAAVARATLATCSRRPSAGQRRVAVAPGS